jgi:hypothetical protein
MTGGWSSDAPPRADARGGGGRGWREAALVVSGSLGAATALTWPLVPRLGRLARVDTGDGQFSIWVVNWVARTLAVDPRHVLDANIFYPRHLTLTYSEANIGAGAIGAPVYWATRNPYLTYNFVVLVAFVLSATGMYYLARYLTSDRRAAALAAVCFAFCPYVFGHTAEIQLLFTAGLPFSLLAFHRMSDRPTPGRGAALGLSMAGSALCCGYYGVFLLLMIGYAVLVVVATRGVWRSARFWFALLTGALVAMAIVGPLYAPYARLRASHGFRRELEEAWSYSANWSAYLASSSRVHVRMLALLPPWTEVLFPGFVATSVGLFGLWLSMRRRARHEIALLYGGMTALAFWASFGPQAGLYTLLYRAVPVVSWLRAPARFGVVVSFGLSTLAAVGASAVFERVHRPRAAGILAVATAAVELAVPWPGRHVPEAPPAYRMLATLPPGPVLELPFFPATDDNWHTEEYLWRSTSHWMPLVNGYSDYTPPDYASEADVLGRFPSCAAFDMLRRLHARYAVFHLDRYDPNARRALDASLSDFSPFLRLLMSDGVVRLYEVVGYPHD